MRFCGTCIVDRHKTCGVLIIVGAVIGRAVRERLRGENSCLRQQFVVLLINYNRNVYSIIDFITPLVLVIVSVLYFFCLLASFFVVVVYNSLGQCCAGPVAALFGGFGT